jgi:hypothetical protein
MLHLPILRRGRAYRSVDVAAVPDFRTGRPFVELSQANAGLVRRDLLEERQREMREALGAFTARQLVELCGRAADAFVEADLPVGDGSQSPDDYVRQLSATTGLPHALVRRNMAKIRGVLAEIEHVLGGLTRGLPLEVLDRGIGEAAGHALGFVRAADALGVVLPSNSPGVHALWVPAIALKTALVLKPGSAEPWTPYRLIQAFIQAGAPPAAFGYYPTDHAGAGELLRRCGRGMVFGDLGSTKAWRKDPRVEVHGPGYSKVLLDAGTAWERHLDVVTSSVVENGGRSCVNASSVWTTSHPAEIAAALAERFVAIGPRDAEDPDAQLAPFANPEIARRISAMIDADLQVPGALDVTARRRVGGRVVTVDGATYLLPTVVLCESADHPLANREFLFPFVSVVPVERAALPSAFGPTLAITVLTDDAALLERIVASPLLHRLNLGPIPTWRVSWDQPHEGNLFEHLYRRRAVQGRVGAA